MSVCTGTRVPAKTGCSAQPIGRRSDQGAPDAHRSLDRCSAFERRCAPRSPCLARHLEYLQGILSANDPRFQAVPQRFRRDACPHEDRGAPENLRVAVHGARFRLHSFSIPLLPQPAYQRQESSINVRELGGRELGQRAASLLGSGQSVGRDVRCAACGRENREAMHRDWRMSRSLQKGAAEAASIARSDRDHLERPASIRAARRLRCGRLSPKTRPRSRIRGGGYPSTWANRPFISPTARTAEYDCGDTSDCG